MRLANLKLSPGRRRLSALEASVLSANGTRPDAALDFLASDFRFPPGRYPIASYPGVSFSSTGTRYVFNADRTAVQSFAANAIPLMPTRGLVLNSAQTNKCTAYANPTDFTNVTVSGDAAVVASIVEDTTGFAVGIGGNAYQLDNSLAVAESRAACGGLTTNSNQHYACAWVKGGSGRIAIEGAGTSFAASETFQFVSTTVVSPGTSRVCNIYVDAGETIQFRFPSLVETATLPEIYIPTAGASAAIGADSFTLDMSTLGLTATESWTYERDGGSSSTIAAVAGTLTLTNDHDWEKLWT